MKAVPLSTPAGRMLLAMIAASSVGCAAGRAVAQAPSTYVITLNSMSFGPMPTGLRVGDTVTWINRDTVAHTATARDHSFDVRLPPGKSAQLVLSKAGAIPFYCIYHSPMRGVLNVAAK